MAMNSAKTSMRLALLCLCLLVLCCGSADAFSFGALVDGAVRKVKAKAEDVTKKDLNKDGQIGKFRAQDRSIDRQVNKDPNANRRFNPEIDSPTSRALAEVLAEPEAAQTPMLRK
jgi:hypothetical protein